MDLEHLLMNASSRLVSKAADARQMAHPSMTGTAREDALVNVLRPLLPGKIGMTSGKVVGIGGRDSGQCDIVAFDMNECPRFIEAENPTIVPSTGVYGIIEVKSRLTRAALLEDMAKIHRFRQLYEDEPSNLGFRSHRYQFRAGDDGVPFGVIFAFSSSMNDAAIRKVILENERGVPPNRRVNAVVVLERSITSRVQNGFPMLVTRYMGSGDLDVASRVLHKGTLFEFYLDLMEMIEAVRIFSVNPAFYRRVAVEVDGMMVSGQIVNEGTEARLSDAFLRKIASALPSLEAITVSALEQRYATAFGIDIESVGVGVVRVFGAEDISGKSFAPRVLPGRTVPQVTLASAFRTVMFGDDIVLVPWDSGPDTLQPRT